MARGRCPRVPCLDLRTSFPRAAGVEVCTVSELDVEPGAGGACAVADRARPPQWAQRFAQK